VKQNFYELGLAQFAHTSLLQFVFMPKLPYMEHNRKGTECHDGFSAKEVKKQYPQEYNHQAIKLSKTKKLPILVVLDLFHKPLKEFESVRGTPLANYMEPFWDNDYWEIFGMKLEHAEATKKAAAK
jgi:hypothetical protein